MISVFGHTQEKKKFAFLVSLLKQARLTLTLHARDACEVTSTYQRLSRELNPGNPWKISPTVEWLQVNVS